MAVTLSPMAENLLPVSERTYYPV